MGEKLVTSADPRTIPALFFEQARLKGTAPYVWGKVDGNWRPTSWDAAARAVRGMAAAFQDLGVEFGDRIALIAENQPSWVLADLAIMAAGGITVPAYTTYSADDYRHVLDDSGAKIVILGRDMVGTPCPSRCGHGQLDQGDNCLRADQCAGADGSLFLG